MYPSQQEQVVIGAAEKLMAETMARYDPSHDVYHGIPGICHIYFDGSLICSSLKKSKSCPKDCPQLGPSFVFPG
jgi:hypothetical protein